MVFSLFYKKEVKNHIRLIRQQKYYNKSILEMLANC